MGIPYRKEKRKKEIERLRKRAKKQSKLRRQKKESLMAKSVVQNLNKGEKTMKKVALLLVLAIMAMPVVGFSADNYGSAVSEKLQTGITNTLLGWTKVFSVPYDYSQAGMNTWAGVGKGMVDAVLCTGLGAFNLVTFPIPTEFPLPDGGVNLGGTAVTTAAIK